MPAKKESDKSIPRNNRTLAVKKQIVRAFKKKAIKEKFDKRKLSKKNIIDDEYG